MARLIGNTRRRISWMFWVTLAVVLAMFGGAAVWLSTFLSHIVR